MPHNRIQVGSDVAVREALGGEPFGNPKPSGACRDQDSKVGQISLNAMEPEGYGTLHRKAGPALQAGRCPHLRPSPRAPRRFSGFAARWARWARVASQAAGSTAWRRCLRATSRSPPTRPIARSKRGLGFVGHPEAGALSSGVFLCSSFSSSPAGWSLNTSAHRNARIATNRAAKPEIPIRREPTMARARSGFRTTVAPLCRRFSQPADLGQIFDRYRVVSRVRGRTWTSDKR